MIAQVVQVTNAGPVSQPVEYKFWLVVPGNQPISYMRGGHDGSVVLPAGFNQNVGPFALGTINSELPRGAYAFNCAFLDPVTGTPLASGGTAFTVQ